ncbi:pantoate--beta-alanine ligase [Porphyromonas canoris]|uniref:Pantothenate synthetase n=1 Tax=Porphyromonas canoris TaxID=36875 RepID=A0ABR4XMT0_9PORP|nr:pantoate--beta-alanine ligase [Porphyromonas canoris]KGN92270.1 pantoate--beta-alanine ligase [Porphyromonas canoris]
MVTIDNIKLLKEKLSEERKQTKKIGFVPTMGALHDGHISLVKRSISENDITVVSVFLNPTQFNNARDFETYPRDLDRDLRLLFEAGADYVFAPTVEEIYPKDEPRQSPFDLGRVAEVMEGKHRPGHFAGVAEVVSKLFRIVEPDKAYFGEKDFQQIAVIRRMLSLMPDVSIEIIPCEIVREKDGLAMSSRNTRLNEDERRSAPFIYKALRHGVELFRKGASVEEVYKAVIEQIDQTPHLKVEYFSIVDGESLEDIKCWEESRVPVGCITVYCGEVRLIDHIHFTS